MSPASAYALGAIALWATLATLGLALRHVPPFLLTGIGLLVGGLLSVPLVLRDRSLWRIPLRTLGLGVYGLFGFHFLLFLALRHAPPVQANLINYLWPLFMVVLAPVVLVGVRVQARHLLAALLGFAGAATAILGTSFFGGAAVATGGWSWGYLLALASALVWASYSLLSQRVAAFPTAAVGLFGVVSGLLALLCHWVLEPAVALSASDGILLAALGVGPLGLAFYAWDKALKLGDARHIGVLSYSTPVASTALLLVWTGQGWNWSIALATALILAAAVLAGRTQAARDSY